MRTDEGKNRMKIRLNVSNVLSLLRAQGTLWALIVMLKNSASRNMCAWGSSFQWFMGIIGGSTRANRPNRRTGAGMGAY